MRTDIRVVSPHLDDAVLSLGGLIGREVAAGRTVEVVTCFTAGPPLDTIPPKRRVFADYTARRAEDERALAVLGASHRWLDLRERTWRDPPLPRPTHAFRTPPRLEDFAELRAIRAVIADLLDRDAVVYAPLGVGHHVDHVEVALAALQEMLGRGAVARLRFYEDSYAMSRAGRRQHFVARRRMWRRFGSPGWASPRVGALLRVIALAARGPRIDQYLPEAARLDWACEPLPLSADDEERKLTAVAEYGSQVKTFGGIDRARPFLRRGHRVLGGEPIWTCRPGSTHWRAPHRGGLGGQATHRDPVQP
jgi:LmbE family N-acetylglucosaminyl deacetylase